MPLHQILPTFKDASKIVLRIKKNTELLTVETALTEAMSRLKQDNRSKLVSLKDVTNAGILQSA
jgi:hypothetical protein